MNKFLNKFEQNRKLNFFLCKIYHLIFSEKFNKIIKYEFEPNYTRLDLINHIKKKKKLKNYLEIGCDQNQVFDHVDVESKIGVDPSSGGNFRGTSNDFFRSNNKKFDCIFIDGLHEYDQVIKDIKNSLKCLLPGGYVMLHDCLPNKNSAQLVPRCRYKWNGDVWKAIVEVRTWNEYETITCLVDEGISIIQKKKNSNILDMNIKNFKNMKFSFFYYNYEKIMNIKTFKQTLSFLGEV